MIIDNEGVSLHVAQDGNPDGPTVLMLHGITSNVDTWNWLVPHLAADYRLLRLDFRGHGLSGRAEGTYDFRRMYPARSRWPSRSSEARAWSSVARWVVARRRRWRRTPELVCGLILEDPAILRPRAWRRGTGGWLVGGLQDAASNGADAAAERDDCGSTGPDTGRDPGTNGAPLGDSMQPGALAAMASALLQLDATVLDRCSMARSPPPSTPPRPSVPGVVLAGDSAQPDTIVRAELRCSPSWPHIEVRVVTGAGHMIHDSLAFRSTELAAVQEFLAANAR